MGIWSCTNFGITQLQDRVADNFSGLVSHPGDIDPAGANSFSFMVIGDTHIGSPQGEVMNTMAGIAESAGDAFVIVAGDISHGGLDGEFTQFKTVMDTHGMTWRTAIGNHDIFFGGWSRYRTSIGRSIYSFNADNVHFIMLDSANGSLGEQQLQWFEADLMANTRPHVVVVTHFPPWNGRFASIYRMSSEEEAAVLKDICHRYGVDYVFAGHYHGSEETELGGVKYIVTGGANDQMDLGQKQNYVRVTVSGDSISAQIINL